MLDILNTIIFQFVALSLNTHQDRFYSTYVLFPFSAYLNDVLKIAFQLKHDQLFQFPKQIINDFKGAPSKRVSWIVVALPLLPSV